MSKIFGSVRQVGYVVRDIESAMQGWLSIGVGPWFYREKSPMTEFSYHGKPSNFPEISIALANSGDMQIELIQQRNNAPSLYLDMLEKGREGVQHIAYWIDGNFDAWKSELLVAGFEEGHAGRIGSSGRFAYLINKSLPDTIIEISEMTGGKGERFKKIREAAQNWDGSDPIRRVVMT
jgi:hypothetical protein